MVSSSQASGTYPISGNNEAIPDANHPGGLEEIATSLDGAMVGLDELELTEDLFD